MQVCKIKSIKRIQVPLQPVYDITTEHNHNFILKNGSVLHNCDTGQTLLAKGYSYEPLSVDKVSPDKICRPYQYLKSTIYEKRLEIYKDVMLIGELTELERNMDSGKIDHPDGGCFTGETKVKLVDGRSLSFYDLIEEYEKGIQNYVYSVNLDTKRIEPKLIEKAWRTGANKQLLRVTLDDDSYIDCTPNHLFMLRNGCYVEASRLHVEDSLMPLYLKYPTRGNLKDYRLYYEPFEDKWHFEHRRFAEEILDEKHLVHHKNCNKRDNSPTNLLWCSKAAHANIHSAMQTGACSPKALAKKAKSVHDWHEKMQGTEVYIKRSEKTRQSVLEYNLGKYGHNRTADWANHIAEIEHMFNVRWDELTLIEKNSFGGKLARIKDPTITEKCSEQLSVAHSEGKFVKAEEALQRFNEKMKMLKKLYPNIDKDLFKEMFGFDYDSLPRAQKGPWINRYRQRLYDVKNHKVKSIDYLDICADVYDIQVADNHNFALDCGVFVHNCKDIADATCGAVFNASRHAEEYAYDYGEQAEQLLQLNAADTAITAQQISFDMEEELKKINTRNRKLSVADTFGTPKSVYDSIIIL